MTVVHVQYYSGRFTDCIWLIVGIQHMYDEKFAYLSIFIWTDFYANENFLDAPFK